MKRYKDCIIPYSDCTAYEMEECEDGIWVRYEDVEKLMVNESEEELKEKRFNVTIGGEGDPEIVISFRYDVWLNISAGFAEKIAALIKPTHVEVKK